MKLSRRTLLRGLAAGASVVVAGCRGPAERDSVDPDRESFDTDTVQTARQVGNEAEKAVLALRELQDSTLGTAFHIGDGYLLTNAHNVEPRRGRPRVELGPYPGTTSVDATVLGKRNVGVVDLAVLEAPVSALPPLEYASSTDLTDGQPLVSVGHPQGVGNWITMLGSFSTYEADADTDYEMVEQPRTIRSHMVARQGASGAPTLTLDGTVVGCLSGGSGAATTPAPDAVYTDLATDELPSVTEHVDAGVFDDYLEAWR